MEVLITLLIALPGVVISTLQIYDWYKTRSKKSTD